jgi:hypothetical protein
MQEGRNEAAIHDRGLPGAIFRAAALARHNRIRMVSK